VGDEHQNMDLHKKKVMAFVAASTGLVAIILCLLSFWIFYIKYSSKSKKKNLQNSGILC